MGASDKTKNNNNGKVVDAAPPSIVAEYEVIKLSAKLTVYKLPFLDSVSKTKKFDFRVVRLDDEDAYYFCAVDLARSLRYAKPFSKQHSNFKRQIPGLEEKHTRILLNDWSECKPQGLRCYSLEGFELCLQNSAKTAQVERFMTHFCQCYSVLRNLHIGQAKWKFKKRSEDEWLLAIERATYRFVSHRQWPIANNRYKLDLYFPKQRVVVECDENGHESYNEHDEKKRTNAVEEELGKRVVWVRFNPNDVEGTSVERVCGDVLHALYTARK